MQSTRQFLTLFLTVAMIGTTFGVHGEELGKEQYRPRFHFTPERNWMNDPNGMVYYDGEYHLFYQYNPFGDQWGHMSWGHAVSRDLIQWEHLPLALAEENGVMIFSGSAVVDWKNTSGFGKDGKPPLVAIYTGHYTGRPLQNQHIAYSNDRGRTWTKFSGNPVLDVNMADFRDPKVFWHEPSSQWIMVVALATEHKVHFYASPSLKHWSYVGEFGPAGATNGLWECPDLFQLPTPNGGKKWVLIVNINPGGPAGGSGCQYFVGDFDGHRFTTDALSPTRAEFVPQGKVLADFENGYGDWKPDGEAFGMEPAKGTLPRQQPVLGFRGLGMVNSYRGTDPSQGTLTSPLFEISDSYISFLIGGGKHKETCIDLRVDGKVVRSASGKNMERLTWHAWDVRDLRGKRAEIQVVDKHSGDWGHINLDHVILASEPARPADERANWADYGADFYAAVSWSDVPETDGRRLWLGWMSNWNYANDVPTSPWRSVMSVPRELSLAKTADGWQLRQTPVRELKKYQGKGYHFNGGSVEEANEWLKEKGIQTEPFEMQIEFESIAKGKQGLEIYQGTREAIAIGIDHSIHAAYVNRKFDGHVSFHPAFGTVQTAPLGVLGERVKLRLLVDACSIEIFVNDGERSMTCLTFPNKDCRDIELYGVNSVPKVISLDVWKINASAK